MLFGRLARDPRWLTTVAGIGAADVEALTARLGEARRAALLVFARWVLVMTNFERGLYADPDADHDTRWWDLVEQFQRVRRPDGRHAPDWAAKIHLTVAPVYYQNYLYGELVASQLQATLDGAGGRHRRRSPPPAGLLVDEVFRPGRVAALGPARRTRHRRAAHRRASRPRARRLTMDLGLRDRAICIAGGSRGMGRAAAELLAAEGCRGRGARSRATRTCAKPRRSSSRRARRTPSGCNATSSTQARSKRHSRSSTSGGAS